VASRRVGRGSARETQRSRHGRQRHAEDVRPEEARAHKDELHLEEEPSRKPRERAVREYITSGLSGSRAHCCSVCVCVCVCVMTLSWKGDRLLRGLRTRKE